MAIALADSGGLQNAASRWFGETGTVPKFLHGMLVWILLFDNFIGRSPFGEASVASRVEGNSLDRIFVLALCGLAMFVLALHWRALPTIIVRGAAFWIIAAISFLSIAWSDFPDLTLRRSIVLVCQTVIAAGLAVGFRDLGKPFRIFCYSISAVMVVNLISVVVVPSLSVTPIGAAGLYGNKNVAGMVAMTAVIANVALLLLGRLGPGRIIFGLLMLAVSIAFLIVTESKTSIGLSALAALILLGFSIGERGGPIISLALAFVSLCVLSGLIIVFAANDFDPMAVLSLVLEDTSFTGRDDLWSFAWRVGLERPWLGFGYGAFWDVGPGADPLLRADPGSWLGDIELGVINQAHNGYLELWLHIGLPATILATVVTLAALVRAYFHYVICEKSDGGGAAFAFMTMMLFVFILHNLTEASLFMRGIFLFNIMLPILFLVARANEINGTARSRRRWEERQ